MYRSLELSVVILCYRAGNSAREFVPRIIKTLKNAKIINYEVILTANYHKNSADITPKVAADLASGDKRIKYVAKVKEGMMGWDMRSGLNLARGKYIAVIDGDGQVLTRDIIKIYKKIKRENYDIVKTYRVERGDSLWRKLISFFFNVLFGIFFPGLNARDVNSKPKIISRNAFEKLKLSSNDWFIDAEIMIQARRLKLKVGEIPTVFLGLTGRRSFVNLTTVIEFIVNLLKYRIKEFKYSYENTYNRSGRGNREKIS